MPARDPLPAAEPIVITTASPDPIPPSRWKVYARLLRLPAVFTAWADIFLGYVLTHAGIGESPAELLGLLLASSGLYLSGMVLNDVCDAALDARERPERPIPQGQVTRAAALRLGWLLMAAGCAAALSLRWLAPETAGWKPALVAALLAGAVWLYDGFLKRTPVSPVGMGLCRFLNVSLGSSAAAGATGVAWWLQPFAAPHVCAATVLAVYVAGVTWFARTEDRRSRPVQLAGGVLVVNLGLAGVLGWIVAFAAPAVQSYALFLVGAIALSLNRWMLTALFHPESGIVQNTVRTLLLSIITLDAAVIFARTGDALLSLVVALGLVVPALLVGRWIRIT